MHRNRCRRILVFSEYLSAKIETFPEQAVDFSDLSQTTPTRAGRKKEKSNFNFRASNLTG